jgi:hypothetical protein
MRSMPQSPEQQLSGFLAKFDPAMGIGLSFYRGATLPDPHGILQGGGNQIDLSGLMELPLSTGLKFKSCSTRPKPRLIRRS